jgi:glycosyltransferase involved in cell wall biosynthesis
MTADTVGGVWTYALDLAESLRPLGVQTTLAVLGPAPQPDQRAAAEAVPGLRLLVTGLPLDWTADRPEAVLAAGEAVAGLARETAAEIVHLNSPALAAGARFGVPVVGACHSCLASWWAQVKGGELPADFRWRTELLARGYRSCDALVAPTAAFARAAAELYGIARPQVAPNGRKDAAWPLPVKRERFVLTAGRLWDEGKNLAALDRAAAGIDFPVFAAGPLAGPLGQRIELEHAEPLGRLDASSLAAWMDRAPVFASLALYEPFGLGVLEAAQAGCALVLSDIPTFRELWEGAAVFVPPGDTDRAAAELERLLDDADLSARLGALARRRARRFTPRAMARSVAEVYRRALAARSTEAAA